VSEVSAGFGRGSNARSSSILPETVKGHVFSVTAVKSDAYYDENNSERVGSLQ